MDDVNEEGLVLATDILKMLYLVNNQCMEINPLFYIDSQILTC